MTLNKLKSSPTLLSTFQPYLSLSYAKPKDAHVLIERDNAAFLQPAKRANPWTRLDNFVNPSITGVDYTINGGPLDMAQFSVEPLETPANGLFTAVDEANKVLGNQANFDSETWTVREVTWTRDARRKVVPPIEEESSWKSNQADRGRPAKKESPAIAKVNGNNKRKEPVSSDNISVEITVPNAKKARKGSV
jgi:hypothetical protein